MKRKSNNVIPQRKNFVESARKQYGNPDLHVENFWDKKIKLD